MKQFLVMTGMVALGIMIFHLIAGENDSSVFSTVKDLWEHEIQIRTKFP